MAKEEGIILEGTVVDVLPNATFRIDLSNGQRIMGYISGRMRQNDIRILLGDQVILEASPYDLSRGRIIRRK